MPTKRTAFWILLFLIVLTGGAFFRLWRLDDRPMHTDEAVHAEKFASLLEKGFYRYDPDEFHGPVLSYFTLVSAWMRGEVTYPEIDETTLRIVPAVLGILLLLSPLLFVDGFNKRSVLFCVMLLAFSPAFVFYSRYYIQEMLLVCLTAFFLGSLWRWIRSGKFPWALLAGVFLGLMHASKETFIFSVFAAVVALIACGTSKQNSFKIKWQHLSGGLCAAIVTSVLFYSSFGSNWQGVIDSATTYAVWFKRACGQSVHVHPWYYYLDLLTWLEFFEPITWNEDVMVVLSVFGIFFALTRCTIFINKTALIRFWAFYTVTLTVIYCLIPYKTPWCVLSFLFGMAMLSSFVLDWFIEISQSRWGKIVVGVIIFVFALASPIFQLWMLNYHYFESPSNPYVYAHTSEDVFEMVERIERAASASEDGKDTLIQIIAADDDYWPLPWYLRSFTHVGYHNKMDASVCDAPIIVANVRQEQEILETLYSAPKPGKRYLYVPLFEEPLFLRPGIPWQGYIRKRLFDNMQRDDTVPERQGLVMEESFMKAEAAKKNIKDMAKFSHRAMNTGFEVFIQHDDGTYAGRAARAAFNEVDRLEGLLSHFIENSDVSRINRLKPGESEIVSEETMQCLLIARQAYDLTDGAFDITIGRWIDSLKNKKEILLEEKRPSMEQLKLHPDSLTVQVLDESVSVDLGGIGKGYAVDVIAHTLQEWGVQKALIHGGASSVRALKPPAKKKGWPVTLSDPTDGKTVARLEMSEEVLSCSGLQRDEHIINPSAGKPVKDRRVCWIRLGQNAALADALSTAGMIMPMEDVSQMQNNLEGCSMMILGASNEGEMQWGKSGEWPTE